MAVEALPRVAVPAASRTVYLDNLKVVLVAGVIVFHAVASYVDGDFWPYANVQETQLSVVTVAVLFSVIGPVGLLMMALLFLVAGLLTEGSARRKGPGRFARDRLLRLGLPFLLFTQLLWPVAVYALYRAFGHVHRSYWAELRGNYPDNGPLWFVGLLLLVSLVYAGWRRIRPVAAPAAAVTARRLALLAAVVGATSYVIRLAWPYGSQSLLDLNEWQWPECIAMFAVGVVAARQGWLTAVPAALARQARTATACGAAAMALLVPVTLAVGADPEALLGGWNPGALAFAVVGGVMTVFGSVWALSVAQRRLDRVVRHGSAAARSSYGAFLLQGFVVIALAVALRPLPVVAEVKALVVGALGVALSFGLAWLLVRRGGGQLL